MKVVSLKNKPTVNVIGGGFSGLISAYYLDRQGFHVRLFEKSERWGGMIQTYQHPWGIVETAANGLISSDRVEKIFNVLRCDLIAMKKSSRRRYIYRNQKLRRWPLNFVETISLTMKVLEQKLRRKSFAPQPYETVEDWCRSHLTPETERFLLGPALQGIYAGEPRYLSAYLILKSVFGSRKKSKEQDVKDMNVPSRLSPKQASRRRYRGTVAPKKGMQDLIDHLVEYLTERKHELLLGQDMSEFELVSSEEEDTPTVIATDFFSTRAILKKQGCAPKPWDEVKSVPLATVTLEMEKLKSRPQGFGVLFPEGEGVESLGVLLNTFIFSDRAKDHTETWILGGTRQGEIGSWNEEQILEQVLKDRQQVFNETLQPRHHQVTLWPRALPQYDLNLEKGLNDLELPKGVFLCGNYLGGIGLSKIIDRAFENAISVKRMYG